jgi:hypothetical protein
MHWFSGRTYSALPLDSTSRREPLRKLEAAWSCGDFVFNTDFDVVSDLTKLLQYICHEILRTLRRLQTARVIISIFAELI